MRWLWREIRFLGATFLLKWSMSLIQSDMSVGTARAFLALFESLRDEP